MSYQRWLQCRCFLWNTLVLLTFVVPQVVPHELRNGWIHVSPCIRFKGRLRFGLASRTYWNDVIMLADGLTWSRERLKIRFLQYPIIFAAIRFPSTYQCELITLNLVPIRNETFPNSAVPFWIENGSGLCHQIGRRPFLVLFWVCWAFRKTTDYI